MGRGKCAKSDRNFTPLMTLLRIIRSAATLDTPDWNAAAIVCMKCGLLMELIPRVREIIRHEKMKTI